MNIENIKKCGRKYKIMLDNGEVITTYDDVILKNDLLFSSKIDEKLFEKIINDTLYYNSYNKVLDMIMRRLRSEKEIREYLKRKKVSKKDIDKIIVELKNIGLVNDLNFAKAFANDKIYLNLDGPLKIKMMLRNHQVEDTIIEDVIDNIDSEVVENNLKKIISKKTKGVVNISQNAFKQKLTNYLINLGYDKVDIENNLEGIQIKSSDKEMKKIYLELSKKYRDEQLIFKLKTKLYSKGYTTDEINEFIEKQF